ncbi:hypothetical protein PVAP13_8KG317614, partial [Panicum virgatum]
NVNLLCWNVRGLNAAARRASVHNTVTSSGASIVCLQETKIAHWTTHLVVDTLGQHFARNFVSLPASGTRWGILIAVDENFFNLHNSHTTEYNVSADITMRVGNISWTLTGVYGPQEDRDKLSFLDEIKGLRQIVQVEWLIVGDFNLIYKAEDKSNDRLNRRMMSYFRQTIDEAQLMEIDL